MARFRWVACQLDHLCNLTSDRERLAALERLPRTLEATYDRILERVNERGDSACMLVERILCWLSHPHSVLSVRQLCEAIAIEPGSTSLDTRDVVDVQDILIHCSSLVRLSADGKIVEFAHFTVGEYLKDIDLARKPHLKRYRWDSSNANTYKAETCLTALRFGVLNKGGAHDMPSLLSQLSCLPFLLHAAEGWNHYLDRGHGSEALNALTSQLLCTPEENNFVNWRHLFVLSKTKTRTSLWAACHRVSASALQDGVTELDTSISEDDWNDHEHDWIVAQQIGQSTTELHFAAMFHLSHLIKPLATSMARINSQSSMGTPLHCALLGVTAVHCAWETSLKFQVIRNRTAKHREGLAMAVRSLLDAGADVQIDCRPLARSRSTTAFIAYSVGELETMVAAGAVLDETTADLILKEDSLDKFTYLRGMDVSKVAESDRLAVVRLLRRLRKPQDGSAPSIPAKTAASIFTDGQQKLIHKYQDALVDACRKGDLETLEWIFEGSGTQVDQTFKGFTLLHIACEESSVAVTEYLLGKGADVNKLNDYDFTALGSLLSEDHFDRESLGVLKVLLAAGASVHGVARAGGHSLLLWAELQLQEDEDGDSNTEELKEALQALLSHGADPLRSDEDQDNVWHQLARNPDGQVLAEMILPLLSDTVIRDSIDVRSNKGYTPLLVATGTAHAKMMKLFIGRGADPNARTLAGRTMLEMAMACLTDSDEPFKLAIGMAGDGDDVDDVCSQALAAFTRSICDNHNAISSDTPGRLREALHKLTKLTSTQTLREAIDSRCIIMLAKWLAEYGYHNLEKCTACTVRLECFQVFVQLLYDGQRLNEANLACFGVLAEGPRIKSRVVSASGVDKAAWFEAICTLLDLDIPVDTLMGLLETSSFVSTAARLHNISLLESLLAAISDVDTVTNGLSLLAWLCYWAVPEPILTKAVARSNKLDQISDHGFCLIHRPFEAFAQGNISVQGVENVVKVLIESGADINVGTTPGRVTALTKSTTLPSPATMELLLRHGADITLCDQFGGNALTEACFSGHEECVRILIERGCPSVYQRQWWKYMGEEKSYLFGPFQAAAQSGSFEVLRLLFDLCQLDADGMDKPNVPSPLWLACSLDKNTKSVSLLLEQGLDVNYVGPEDGRTSLHHAAMMGSLSNIQALLQAGANCNALDHEGHSPDMLALMQGHADAAKMIVEHNTSDTQTNGVVVRRPVLQKTSDLQQWLSDKISELVSWSEVKMLRKLTAHGVDLSLPYQSCNCTPLTTAIATGKASVATYLLTLRTVRVANVCTRHFPDFHSMFASLAAQDDMIKPLQKALELHPPLSPPSWECLLQSAVVAGNTAGLELLLSKQVRPDLASWSNRTFMVKVHILDEDGHWKYEDRCNGTALHTAVFFRQHKSVDILLRHGFDPENFDEKGNTPLHVAAYCGSTRSVEMLHSRGCNLEVQSVALETALRTATRRGKVDVVNLLLDLGADFKATDGPNQDLLGSASEKGRFRVFLRLIRAGLVPSHGDICDIYSQGYRSVLLLDEVIKSLGGIGSLCHVHDTVLVRDVGMSRAFLMRPFLKRHPPYLLKLGLTARRGGSPTPLYAMAISGAAQVVELLHRSGAMLNLEGGMEGTPLMAACKAGRLEVVKYLVCNGAVLSYIKYSAVVSALKKAASYPLIVRWLLVERFTDQRMITSSRLTNGQVAAEANGCDAEADEYDGDSDEFADVTLDLVFEEVLEQYLESRNWFSPRRRFVDNGEGAFYRVPIVLSEFGRYRPQGFELRVR
jgi:ankyrin repeat protein